MKINKPSKNKTIVTASIVGAIILISAAAAVYYFNSNNQNKELTEQTDKTSAVKEEQVVDATDENQDDGSPALPQKNPTKADGSVSDRKSNVATPSTAPEKPNLSRAGQSGDEIKAVAILHESSPGYCELQLNQSGQETIRSETTIIVGPSYYACDFVVPVNQLPSKGQWSAVVIHHIGDAQTKSNVRYFTVR